MTVGKLHAGDGEEDLSDGDDCVLGQEPHDVDLVVLHDRVWRDGVLGLVPSDEEVVAGPDLKVPWEGDVPVGGLGTGDGQGVSRSNMSRDRTRGQSVLLLGLLQLNSRRVSDSGVELQINRVSILISDYRPARRVTSCLQSRNYSE